MIPQKPRLKKLFALSGISSTGWDKPELVSQLGEDGRCDQLEVLSRRPSGLAAIGLSAAQAMPWPSPVAIGGVVGDDPDADELRKVLEQEGIDTRCLFPIPGQTRCQRVSVTAKGKRWITRLAGGVPAEGGQPTWLKRKWKSLAAQSEALVVGHLDAGLSEELIGWCRQIKTFVTLVPGDKQLCRLSEYRPDSLVLNASEAAIATGAAPGEATARVFARLLAITPAPTVTMTGGGEEPTHFVDRIRGAEGSAPPADLHLVASGSGGTAMGLGAGDVFACVLTRCLSLGQNVELAVDWARLYATGHVCGQRFQTRAEAEKWSAANRAAFPPVEIGAPLRIAA